MPERLNLGIDGLIWDTMETGVAGATRRLSINYVLANRRFDVTTFVSEQAPRNILPGSETNHCHVVPLTQRRGAMRVVWQQTMLPRLIRRHRIDVMYSPCYTLPLAAKVPSVLTVHDMIAWKRPDLCPLRNVVHFRSLVGASVRKAACITVPTETVKEDLLNILGVSPSKVHVVNWGVDCELQPIEANAAKSVVKESFGIDFPFILSVGCLERKKNLAMLLKAARQLKLPVVHVGPTCRQSKQIQKQLRHEAENSCHFLGYVSNEQLSALYSATEVFVFPSIIEGFGLPVVEAMQFGVPVIASDTPALLEVCGGAALHVPANDSDALAEQIKQVIEDSQLKSSLIQRGLERSRTYTWNRSISQFSVALEQAVLS